MCVDTRIPVCEIRQQQLDSPDFADMDVYLIKRKKLFAMSQTGEIIKECYLSRQ
jgi:hypothetical protein